MADDGAVTFTQAEVDARIEEANAALEAKRTEILTELRTAKDRLKVYDGLDPDEARGWKTKLTELEQTKKASKAGITSEELDRLRAEVRADLEGEYLQFKTLAEAQGSEIRDLKLNTVVKDMMGKAGVRGERVEALFRLTADEYDLTDDGKPMLKARPGTEVTKYITDELVKEYPEFFNGSGSSGGGASKSISRGGGTRVVQADDDTAFLANLEGIASGEVAVS